MNAEQWRLLKHYIQEVVRNATDDSEWVTYREERELEELLDKEFNKEEK